jgi:hypothetical protein
VHSNTNFGSITGSQQLTLECSDLDKYNAVEDSKCEFYLYFIVLLIQRDVLWFSQPID